MSKTVAIVLLAITLVAVIGRGITFVTEHKPTRTVAEKAATASVVSQDETATTSEKYVLLASLGAFEAAEELAATTDETQNAAVATAGAAAELYDILTDTHVVFYETYISKRPVVTSVSTRKMERLTATYGCTVKKMQAMLLLQNLLILNGKSASLGTLNTFTPTEMLTLGTAEMKTYLSTLSDEERAELKAAAKDLV